MSDNDVVILPPSNHLRAKVGNKPGPNLDSIIADAEAALGELKDQYEVWVRNDLDALKAAMAALREASAPTPELLKKIKLLSHEIKGQGTTFGYPLLTQAGQLLESLIEYKPIAAANNLAIVAAHVDFMALVVAQGILDDGDAKAQRTLAGLRAAAEKL